MGEGLPQQQQQQEERNVNPGEQGEQMRHAFIESNNGKLLAASRSEIVAWDNITRRQNGAPEIDILDLLYPGQCATNNGVTVMCNNDSSGNERFYISIDENINPGAGGFEKVSSYVPFSNGVSKSAVPVVARFMEEQMQSRGR